MDKLKWDNLKTANWDKIKQGDYFIDKNGLILEYTGLKKHHKFWNDYDFVFRVANPGDGEPKNQAIILPANSETLDEVLRLLFKKSPTS